MSQTKGLNIGSPTNKTKFHTSYVMLLTSGHEKVLVKMFQCHETFTIKKRSHQAAFVQEARELLEVDKKTRDDVENVD